MCMNTFKRKKKRKGQEVQAAFLHSPGSRGEAHGRCRTRGRLGKKRKWYTSGIGSQHKKKKRVWFQEGQKKPRKLGPVRSGGGGGGHREGGKWVRALNYSFLCRKTVRMGVGGCPVTVLSLTGTNIDNRGRKRGAWISQTHRKKSASRMGGGGGGLKLMPSCAGERILWAVKGRVCSQEERARWD